MDMGKPRTSHDSTLTPPAGLDAPPARGSARIHVATDHTIDHQARAYAEYRVFTAVAHLEAIDSAQVVLSRGRRSPTRDIVHCRIALRLDGGATVRVRAAGTHPYEAIDRATTGIGAAVDRRSPAHLTGDTVTAARSADSIRWSADDTGPVLLQDEMTISN